MENNNKTHPKDPHSNVPKFSGYDPTKYALEHVPFTVLTDESLTPGRPPCQTQRTVGMFLQPLCRDLVEVPPRPTVKELPVEVIDNMTQRDKAFWVDKPGANAYTLHDAFHQYGITSNKVSPHHQAVFPRSYQYDLDCVRHRRLHECDGLKQAANDPNKKPLKAHCRDCRDMAAPALTPFQLAWAQDPGQRRWRYYPELTATMTPEQIKQQMNEIGRPFQHEACNWYYKNYPSVKYDCIVRKFSK